MSNGSDDDSMVNDENDDEDVKKTKEKKQFEWPCTNDVCQWRNNGRHTHTLNQPSIPTIVPWLAVKSLPYHELTAVPHLEALLSSSLLGLVRGGPMQISWRLK